MKKKIKKLSLSRETVLNLEQGKLKEVGGAFELDSHYDHTCGTVCDIPSWHCTYCSIC